MTLRMKQVTIQGEPGCFHEEAARRYFGDEPIEIVPCRTFEAQFERMRHEGSLLGIVAIENTIAGSLLQNHELLRRSESQIIGECKLRISHVLAALPGQRLDELSEVNSHPIALMQCGEFLKAHPQLKAVERDDTAGSAREIAEQRLRGTAAICGVRNARHIFLGALSNCSAAARKAAGFMDDILIVCSGTNRMISADDLCAAGAIINRLRSLCSELELTDIALICEHLYNSFKSGTFDLRKTFHCSRLISLGFERDVDYCLSEDSTDCVPVYANGIITK